MPILAVEASQDHQHRAAGSAIILKDTEPSEYTGAESWASNWYQVTLKNSLWVTTTSLRFRIRASTKAHPPQREPVLRAGLYIPNLVVDIDQFFQNVAQNVDVGAMLTAWECRKPLDSDAAPNLCVAYVELTVTVTSSFLAEWSQSYTFAIRGDTNKVERIESKVVPA